MQTRKFLTAAFALAILFLLLAPSPASASVSVSISFFHDQLAPHGRWVVAGSYGNVWVPAGVRAGWAPYVDGQWVWTDYGWTWVSYDPWGDIPYHYGTWTYVSDYGWCWAPGTVWAPAWVTWAYSDDYIGWAPVPASFVLTSGGYFGGPIVVSASRYCFVPTSQFVGVNVSTVRVPIQQNTTIFTRATKATGFQVSGGVVHTAGLDPARIQRVTGHQVARASIGQVHSQPTTISAAGVSKSKTLGVVAPAKVRAQELKTASAHTTSHPTASNKTTVNREAHTTASTKTTKASPKTATTHETTSVAAKPAPQTKIKTEHHATTTSAQNASKSTHSKPVTEEKSRVAVQHQPKVSTTTAAQTHVAEKHVVEKPRHTESQTPRTEQHTVVNRPETVKVAPPKEHAPPPQQVASNRSTHSQAVPPKKEKNPPPKEEQHPREQRP